MIVVVAAFIIILMERIQPYIKHWNKSQSDIVLDFTHLFLSQMGTAALVQAIFTGLLIKASAWLSSALHTELWPLHWPVFLQFVLALIIAEFGTYWMHRFFHENPLLWRIHVTHHSPLRLYWLNAARFHPLDTFLSYSVSTLVLVFLGAGEEVLSLFLILTVIHGLFQHCNIDVRLGPLNYIFSMAQLHRWHHSKTISESNSNYGANLILWDIIFGTRFLPKDRLPPEEIGLVNMDNFPLTYLGQIISPFSWKNNITELNDSKVKDRQQLNI